MQKKTTFASTSSPPPPPPPSSVEWYQCQTLNEILHMSKTFCLRRDHFAQVICDHVIVSWTDDDTKRQIMTTLQRWWMYVFLPKEKEYKGGEESGGWGYQEDVDQCRAIEKCLCEVIVATGHTSLDKKTCLEAYRHALYLLVKLGASGMMLIEPFKRRNAFTQTISFNYVDMFQWLCEVAIPHHQKRWSLQTYPCSAYLWMTPLHSLATVYMDNRFTQAQKDVYFRLALDAHNVVVATVALRMEGEIADIDRCGPDFNTLLDKACRVSNVDMVKWLAEHRPEQFKDMHKSQPYRLLPTTRAWEARFERDIVEAIVQCLWSQLHPYPQEIEAWWTWVVEVGCVSNNAQSLAYVFQRLLRQYEWLSSLVQSKAYAQHYGTRRPDIVATLCRHCILDVLTDKDREPLQQAIIQAYHELFMKMVRQYMASASSMNDVKELRYNHECVFEMVTSCRYRVSHVELARALWKFGGEAMLWRHVTSVWGLVPLVQMERIEMVRFLLEEIGVEWLEQYGWIPTFRNRDILLNILGRHRPLYDVRNISMMRLLCEHGVMNVQDFQVNADWFVKFTMSEYRALLKWLYETQGWRQTEELAMPVSYIILGHVSLDVFIELHCLYQIPVSESMSKQFERQL